MMTRAGLVVTIAVITLGIVDLCFVLFNGTGTSISAWMVAAGFKSPVYVFATGFICGHLFGYFEPTEPK